MKQGPDLRIPRSIVSCQWVDNKTNETRDLVEISEYVLKRSGLAENLSKLKQ